MWRTIRPAGAAAEPAAPAVVVIARSTQEAIVVNVDGL